MKGKKTKNNYTKKRGKSSRRHKVSRRHKGGFIPGIQEVILSFLLDSLKDYLEERCVESATKNGLKDAQGKQITTCGITNMRNSSSVLSAMVKRTHGYYKDKFKKYGNQLPKIFMDNLRVVLKEDLGETYTGGIDLALLGKLKKKENRNLLKKVVQLTLDDDVFKSAEDGDVGMFFAKEVSAQVKGLPGKLGQIRGSESTKSSRLKRTASEIRKKLTPKIFSSKKATPIPDERETPLLGDKPATEDWAPNERDKFAAYLARKQTDDPTERGREMTDFDVD